MNDEVHLSFGEIRAAAHQLAQDRRKARKDYEAHSRSAAEAEARFRKKLAVEYAKYRAGEKGSGEAEILAQGDAADDRLERDLSHSKAKASLLRIEELEADRAMLRQLGEWSKELEATG